MKFLVLMAERDHFDRWDASSDAEQQAVFDCFKAFGDAVRERGSVIGGEGLDHPKSARTLNPGPDRTVTDGPYAETVEQLTGFYVVESDDLDDLLEVCGVLAGAEGAVEVRSAVDHSGDPA